MLLKSVPPTQGIPVARLAGECWEMGVYPVAVGYRVRAGRIGACWYVLDYCAGDNDALLKGIYLAVRHILEALPEDIDEAEVTALFPGYERRPIDQDPCLEKLLTLAASYPKQLDTAEAKDRGMVDLIRIEQGIARWLSTKEGQFTARLRSQA